LGVHEPSRDRCLGLIEIDSVPSGLACADGLVKEAPVRVLASRPITPAIYIVIFEGDVESVRRCLARARDLAGNRFLGETNLPHPHPQLLDGLQGKMPKSEIDAVGILQTTAVSACLQALDAALKEGEIHLLELRLAMGLGGSGFFSVTGEVSQVTVAMEAAKRVAGAATCDSVVISQPDPEFHSFLQEAPSPFSDLI